MTERTDEEIARELCHRLCNDCVMVTNPERPKCTPENCMTMAALRSVRLAERERQPVARPLTEWHEDIGDVLWWKFPIDEPPYVGTPLELGHTVEITVHSHGVDKLMRVNVGGWAGYHTHWTPIIIPAIRETDSDA